MRATSFVTAFVLIMILIACNNKFSKNESKAEELTVHDITTTQPETVTETDTQILSAPLASESRGMAMSKSKLRRPSQDVEYNTEEYDHIQENGFKAVVDNPVSTFSIDVDGASYSNVRRYIESGIMPPPGAVRIEEMINYFDYAYEQPKTADPFSVVTEVAPCPWNQKHKLVHIGLQGLKIPVNNLPPANLVFLIDVSGSMEDANKLPLVKQSLSLLTEQLRESDLVSIVVYAGAAGLVLPATSGSNKTAILDAINKLEAGGSTAGGQGIDLAYSIARKNFLKEGNNRIVLATDGDFNVGAGSADDLVRQITRQRQDGIFLSVLGFGMGNYKDARMQQLADNGNGNHNYIDNLSEARKVFVSEFGGTLFTIASDVKIQLEFNPQKVASYRLIGYENRMLNREDFNDDKKDAGELGSGHTVTALYEVIPAGVADTFTKTTDPLRYQKVQAATSSTDELLFVKLRYKAPKSDKSQLMSFKVNDTNMPLEATSTNFRFSAAVASFGMLLRNSDFKQSSNYEQVLQLARSAIGDDPHGYRKGFCNLVMSVERIAKR